MSLCQQKGVYHHKETKFARIEADIYKVVGKLVTLSLKFSELCWMWVSLNKQMVCILYPNFFPVNMIFSAVQPLGHNKICMGFNPRRCARGPLSAPRLSVNFNSFNSSDNRIVLFGGTYNMTRPGKSCCGVPECGDILRGKSWIRPCLCMLCVFVLKDWNWK